MPTKYNDRRSGPEGSFWWFDWLGNIDDRLEIEAHNTPGASFTWNPFVARQHQRLQEQGLLDYASQPAYYEGARLLVGLQVDSYNDDGSVLPFPATATINIPQYYNTFSIAHSYAADGGAQAIEYICTNIGGNQGYDPYSLHLGFWFANTSTAISPGIPQATNYAGNGKVWQTFSVNIAEPEILYSGYSNRNTIILGLRYDEKEKQGFRNRFGALEGDSIISLMNDVVSSMAEEIEVTKLSSQPIFNEIVLDKGFNYNKRSFLSTEEEEQTGIASELTSVSEAEEGSY